MLTEKDLRGATKKYESLPASEKESIDRQFEEMTRKVEQHDESRTRSAERDLQEVAKEVGTHCHRVIVNGGYFQVPSKHGGNVMEEQPLSEEQKRLEHVVNLMMFSLNVEQGVALLETIVDKNKLSSIAVPDKFCYNAKKER